IGSSRRIYDLNQLYHLTVFFFQAEDGIRDFHVTGVQTCALPISVAGDQAARLEGVDEAAGPGDRVGERLLHQGADPGVGELQADLFVQAGGAGHHRVVDAQVEEFLDGVQDGRALRGAVLVAHGVDDGHEVDALQAGQDAGVVTPHGAEADESGPQASSVAHSCSSSAFTAATTRSRSCCDRPGWTGSETTSAAALSVRGRSQVRPAFWSGSQYGFS